MNNSIALITFTMLCDYHHYINLKLFYHPKQNSETIKQYLHVPSSLQPPVVSHLLPVFMNMFSLDISHSGII